eukprot:205434-Pyramimonas_sp.AAC.1
MAPRKRTITQMKEGRTHRCKQRWWLQGWRKRGRSHGEGKQLTRQPTTKAPKRTRAKIRCERACWRGVSPTLAGA